MRSRARGPRAVCIAAAVAAALAMTGGTAVATTAGGHPDRSPHFTASQLAQRTKRYIPRSDGTPGLVADASGGSGAVAPRSATGSTRGDQDAEGFESKGSIETARGAATTLALAGTGDWAAITSAGTIARYDSRGHLKWHVGIHDLIEAWQVTPKQPYHSEDLTPVMYEGYSPYQPTSTGRHPFASADFNGDHVADVAVAYQYGVDPANPFTVPGSALTSGTFVSILDGRTGKVIWHVLVPGTVGSMIAQDGKLIFAETTGPNSALNAVPEQVDSRSSLVAYRFKPGHRALNATKAWTYSTGAPDADWTDIESMGRDRITAGWTDTPMGLGSPRPPDGHVLVVDTRTGKAVTDVKTPGYPRIVQRDARGDRVLVAEQNDPTEAVRWSLTRIDVHTGRRSVVATFDGKIPESVAVNAHPHGNQPQYVLAQLTINDDLTDGAWSIAGIGRSGRTSWSHTTSSTVGAAESPVLGITIDDHGHGQVLAAVGDGVQQSLKTPDGPDHTQLVALDLRSGERAWRRDGAVTGDRITPYRGGYLTVGYDLTAWQTDRHGRAEAMPMMGDLYAADTYDVNHDGVNDLIAAGQSKGVFALDGRSLRDGRIKVLWKQAISASAHAVHVARVAGRHGHTARQVVVATSHGFAVLDPHTGRIVSDENTGAFQWDDPVVDGHIVASSDTSVGAYTADGRRVWAYRPNGTGDQNVIYSAPATDGKGRIFLEYGGVRTSFSGTSAPAPTAVALDAAHGTELWTRRPSAGAKAAWMQAQAGVHASPAVPGADGHGVAFAFGGDKPGSRGHTVMIVDGRTGDTVDSKTGNGSATFQGFTSAKDQGLLWLHAFQMTMLATDGSAAYDLATMGNVFQGVFATAKDGSRVFVGGEGGVSDWATPLPHSVDGNYYPGPLGSAFAYFAGSVTPLPMDDDRATDLVALPHDYQAYNLSQNVGAYGANPHAVDAYPHGVAVLQATGARAATGDDAADSAPPARRKRAATAAPLPVHTMPVGVAEAPHQILSKQPASGHVETADIRGYTPKQLNRRLGLTGDGSGQTVAIAIAYDYPTAKEDLNHYSQQFGLPQTCDVAPDQTDCFHFEVTYADGTKPASNANWNQEAALDIEAVHAVAPRAKIVLVEAKDASAAALYRAVDAAATLNPAAINNSWGMPEFSEESFYDSHCDLTNSVCVQSTGDAGHPAGYSSTNPHVLAVGGTHLELDAGGNTISESAWASGGGGLSYFEERPAYQKSANRTGRRGTPDVSFDADPHTGIAMYVTVQGQHYWMQVGGTSLSSPLWAGILSTADQLRVAHDKSPLVVDGKHGDTLHRAVYDLGDALFDVTDGSNGLCGAECTAGPGYDTATGLGSPLAGIDVALAKK